MLSLEFGLEKYTSNLLQVLMMAASEQAPESTSARDTSFQWDSGTASFSRMSREAWWIERPTTCVSRPLLALFSRSFLLSLVVSTRVDVSTSDDIRRGDIERVVVERWKEVAWRRVRARRRRVGRESILVAERVGRGKGRTRGGRCFVECSVGRESPVGCRGEGRVSVGYALRDC